MLHDAGDALLVGDIVQVIPDRGWVGFMYSYPNLIPLPAERVEAIARALRAVRVRDDLRRLVGPDRARATARRSCSARPSATSRALRGELP